MKSILVIVFCISLLNSCRKDNHESSQGTMVFKFQTKGSTNLKSAKSAPSASFIVLTIEKSDGEVIFNKEKLALSYLNGSYISKDLALPQGNYNLTEFLVTDVNNQIIYASPKKDSKLAFLVSNPLPLNFNIQSNQESILMPEVVQADTSKLNEMGYIGFSFNVKGLKFLVTVLSKDSNEAEYKGVDSCNLTINIYKNLKLGAANEVNSVYVNKGAGNYILTFWKLGYNSISDTLTESELEKYSTKPLRIILKPIKCPSIWFIGGCTGTSFLDYNPNISISPITNQIIDYGNGHAEKIPLQISLDNLHGNKLIQIYGDIKSIKSLQFSGDRLNYNWYSSANIDAAVSLENLSLFGFVELDGISLKNMHKLKRVNYWSANGPLDFTNCNSLESISLYFYFHFTPTWDVMDIRTNDSLKSLSFDGTRTVLYGKNPVLTAINISPWEYLQSVSKEDLNRNLIALLASVESSPRSGTLTITQRVTSPIIVYDGEGRDAAEKLRDKYGWTYTPDILNGHIYDDK